MEIHIRHKDAGGNPHSQVLYADGEGVLRWSRLDYRDRAGDWTIAAETADKTLTFSYQLAVLDLGDLESLTFGVPLKVYRGPRANIFFSGLVPAAFAVDLQDHLGRFSRVLEEQLGIRSVQTPDIYVAGSGEQLIELLKAQGRPFVEAPGGYFSPREPRPGIYLRTDINPRFVPLASAHEYVHLVMKEYMEGKSTFVWISEGVAEYYSFEAGLETDRSYALSLIHQSADTVLKGALEEGLSFYDGISTNGHDWGYMFVRYVTETIGANAAIEVMTEYNDRETPIEEGIEAALGTSYAQFEQDFMAWLEEWDDPRRAEIRPYLTLLQGTLDYLGDIGQRRRDLFDALREKYDRNKAIEGYAPLVAESERLLNELQAYSRPEGTENLNENALSYLQLNLKRFRLEQEAHDTGDPYATSEYATAVAMIPELIARVGAFRQGVSDARTAFNLFD